jgi:hypothetical protein
MSACILAGFKGPACTNPSESMNHLIKSALGKNLTKPRFVRQYVELIVNPQEKAFIDAAKGVGNLRWAGYVHDIAQNTTFVFSPHHNRLVGSRARTHPHIAAA